MIGFKQIPANLRVPMFFAEVDNSQANTATLNQRALIFGQMTTGVGASVANVPVISQGIADAKLMGGPGSQLALMVEWYRKRDTFGELWVVPLADDGAATAAVGSLNFTHVATANGTLALYIHGVRVPMPVLTTQTVNNLATALAAAVNLNTDLNVTAAVDGVTLSKVNFTCKNLGAAGNDIDLRLNYLGTPGGEATPAGVTVTIVQPTGGATNPSLTAALTALGAQPYDFIVLPYVDTASLNALQAFMNDVSGRWSWQSMVYGHVFTAYRGTVGARTTFGTGRNDPHASVMGFYDSPSPNWLWAANEAGACANSLRADPGLPLHTLALDVLAPPVQSQDILTDQNTMLFDGISTFTVDDDGTVRIQSMITTYQKNPFGQPDNSYLKVETLFTLAFALRFLRTRVTSKFGRVKLAADGTRFGAGANVVTPSIIRADQIAAYQELETDFALVQGSDFFAEHVIVEQDAQNPNRVNELWPGILINQLDIFALLAQFRLAVPST